MKPIRNPRIQVLVSAYACAPNRGAEPGVGWNLVAILAGEYGYDLTVITRTKHREAIEGSDDPRVKNIRWIYADLPDWVSSKKRGALGLRLFYLLWQRKMHSAALEYIENHQVDLVHHLTFGSILPATALADFELPLVVGPVGGAEMSPPGLVGDLAMRLWIRDRLRAILYYFGSNLESTRKTYRACSVALGATEASVKSLKELGAADVRLVPQSGCGGDEVAAFASENPLGKDAPEGPIRLLSASRLVHWKGVDLTVDAVHRAVEAGHDIELTIVQEGPELGSLKKLVKRRGLIERVKFLGKLESLEDVYREMRRSDALMHPAVNEAFGQSILESLALGRQVICLDWAGPGMIVTADCGIKVESGNREKIVTGLAEAIMRLGDRRSEWFPIQEAAIARSQVFSWQQVAEKIDQAYRDSLG
ncbi:glycosyltransferase [Akkermansiaceae bacterium]|nr:glycosyltransferase [Akkermansiaceae bacterium]MDB4729565.1 glycosyltransferase [Akkermansiaceae bacterium]MDB4813651.1 glycosyltransferase [bacterium]